MTEHLTEITLERSPRAEVDASPWGGGAALYEAGRLTEFWALQWSAADAADCRQGDPAGQTSWELLALFITLVPSGRSHRGSGLAYLRGSPDSFRPRSGTGIGGQRLAARRG